MATDNLQDWKIWSMRLAWLFHSYLELKQHAFQLIRLKLLWKIHERAEESQNNNARKRIAVNDRQACLGL